MNDYNSIKRISSMISNLSFIEQLNQCNVTDIGIVV